MLEIVIAWAWIFVSAFLWGFSFIAFFEKKSGLIIPDFDLRIIFGICWLTVFSQYFSLFCGVGFGANILVLICDFCIGFALKKEVKQYLKSQKDYISKNNNWIRLLVLTTILLLAAGISSDSINHYDSDLYHAQSIRWIEEYGVVPGLGNLHNRLAYNSSFFSLQALFSLRYVVGHSMHCVNGFLFVLFMGYIIFSGDRFILQKRKSFQFTPYFLKIGLLIYLIDSSTLNFLSSPNSDIPALCLSFYVLIKCADELCNANVENKLALLSLLSIFSISIKLSALMLIFIALIPAFKFIKNKNSKAIIIYILLGFLIILPFFIRNLLISGYLIYPYPELDLFHFDWKMPRYTLLYDRNEIKAWGMGINDVYKLNTPFEEWFPAWFKAMKVGQRFLFVLNLTISVPAILLEIICGIKNKKWDEAVMLLTIMACLGLWFFGAPLTRYGWALMLLMPLFFCGRLLDLHKYEAIGQKTRRILLIGLIAFTFLQAYQYLSFHGMSIVYESDYKSFEVVSEKIKPGISIFYPSKGDRTGYYAFPSTPYKKRLELIEMRGDRLKNGFRIKTQYLDQNITTYGFFDKINIFLK